ncbi:hypothetical protein L596_029129 [Steinernema carpocapsae]|uniref:Uncharacterized protein n=1 Tax=Steinernema carpocapsae TaxID=34508 RepID=A0A4U5LTQ7_STECR|nr:hypothetical protein L596_029129 [Steinernema carpocapsae]
MVEPTADLHCCHHAETEDFGRLPNKLRTLPRLLLSQGAYRSPVHCSDLSGRRTPRRLGLRRRLRAHKAESS